MESNSTVGIPNPIADMVQQAVKDAVADSIREIIREELKPLLDLATDLENAKVKLATSKGMLARQLHEFLAS
jgi:hypothetical protein